MGKRRVRGAGGQARGVFLARGVEGAEAMFGAVCFNFEVVGDGCLHSTRLANSDASPSTWLLRIAIE